MPSPAKQIDTYEKARELTPALERGSREAVNEVNELRKTMPASDYNKMMQNIQINNDNDRQLNDKLPKLVIVEDGKTKRYVAASIEPRKVAPEADRPVEQPKVRVERDRYPNTNAGREQIWKDVLSPKNQ